MRFLLLALTLVGTPVAAAAQTPLAGHYPPGQSGLRGGASPPRGWAYTNFSRAFTNLEAKDAAGETVREVGETRFANISMITCITHVRILGLTYGALAGIPFGTGNLNPSEGDLGSKNFGLGDVLITPVALYRTRQAWDAQFQFPVWTAPGNHELFGIERAREFPPSSTRLAARGTGGDRHNWSVSAIARIEQNFEQKETGTKPGDDVVIDWGLGRSFESRCQSKSASPASPSGSSPSRRRPRRTVPLLRRPARGERTPWAGWTLRLRAQWEFGTVNAVQGNNLWFIVHHAF